MHIPTYIRVTAFAILATASPSAHAYLDPGTGSILLQSLLAGIAVAIGVLRTYWYRIRALFGFKGVDASEPVDNTPENQPDSLSGS